MWQKLSWSDVLKFDSCQYSNCIWKYSRTFEGVEQADVVIFAKVNYTRKFPDVSWETRQRQYWFMMTIESGVYQTHVFPDMYNGRFNGSIMYRQDATIYNPFGKTEISQSRSAKKIDFSKGKTMGAFAYVTRCNTFRYHRMRLMQALSRYIPVHIYSDNCRGLRIKKSPCPRLPSGSNPACETQAHRNYRFFFSFENSLCKDYITEKFWDRLGSPSYFVPIAMGGLTVKEYTSVAPTDSFLHVYNFTSVHKLGKYLKHLMANDDAYNKYHYWRYNYKVNTDRNMSACEICRIAHEKPSLPAIADIAKWRNDPSLCRGYYESRKF